MCVRVCVVGQFPAVCVLGCGSQLLLLQLCGAAGLCLGVGLNASLFNLCVFSEVCLHLRICTILYCVVVVHVIDISSFV